MGKDAMLKYMSKETKIFGIIIGVIVTPLALLYLLPRITSAEYLFLRFSIPRYPNTTLFEVEPANPFVGGGPGIFYHTPDSCEQVFQFYEKKFQNKKWTLIESIDNPRRSDANTPPAKSRKWQAKNRIVGLECRFDGRTSKGDFYTEK